jgi:deazaflavin-dependent oxidoreductase (nitroreductase family)
VTGRSHTIEIWFGEDNGVLYLLSGGGHRSDWVRNMIKHPEVTVRLADESFAATARVVTGADEDALARRLLASKYQGWREGKEMSTWAKTALPVALSITN